MSAQSLLLGMFPGTCVGFVVDEDDETGTDNLSTTTPTRPASEMRSRILLQPLIDPSLIHPPDQGLGNLLLRPRLA